MVFGLFILAQTSTRAPAAAAPRAPAFEYLGRLQAETGTRTVIENGPQGTRTIVQVLGGRFEGPRVKGSVQTPAGDWITTGPTEVIASTFASRSKRMMG